jgi:drug/metabolite transporter (DMT)-like permease
VTAPTRQQGLLEMVGSAVIFGIMAFVVKRVTRTLDGAQIAMVRFGVGCLVVGAQSAIRGVSLRPKMWRFLLLRGLFGGFAVLLYFLSIDALPVGTATLLNYTAPVFTAIFSALFLRERLPAAVVAAMAVTAAGVGLVVYGQGRALGGAYGWQGLALLSSVCSGAAVTSIRAARRTDGAWEVFAMFCVIGVLTTAPLAVPRWRDPTLETWMLLILIGLLAVVAQVLMTHALGAIDGATTGIINELAVVTSIGLGTFIDAEPLPALSALGAIVTMAGVGWAAHVSARTQIPHRNP